MTGIQEVTNTLTGLYVEASELTVELNKLYAEYKKISIFKLNKRMSYKNTIRMIEGRIDRVKNDIEVLSLELINRSKML